MVLGFQDVFLRIGFQNKVYFGFDRFGFPGSGSVFYKG